MSLLSTNKRLISLRQDYSAGENIGIYDHTISSRNWSPDITNAAESAFQRANEYTNTQISALSGEVSSEVSQLGSDIEALSGDVAYISGVALTAHQSLEGYLTKASGDEYYQPIGSYATVSQLESTSGEIVNLIPTDYVSNETLEQTSGNIVNLIPDTSEFITNASAEATYQPIGNYATQDWVSGQGYITGVDLSNYYTKNETSGAEELANAFSQIGPGGDEEVNELVHSNSGEWNNVSAKLDTTAYTPFDPSYMSGAIDEKLDTTAFSTVSGDFLTSIPDEYATKDFVSNSITGKLDISSFSSVSSDFLTNEDLNGYATESFVENVSGDITALIPTDYYPDNNPSGFITGVDLTPYQTIEGMTAYQPVGSYATTNELEQVSADITATIPSTAGLASESYVQTNSAVLTGMIDGKQDTLTFGYDEQDRISAINNSAIAAGDEFPVSADEAIQYVQTNSAQIDDTVTSYQTNSGTFLTAHQAISAEEWNSNYETVNTNSGVWGGSALPISAGPGIKVNLVDNTLVFSNDETLLFSANDASNTIVLSEKATNFERLRLELQSYQSTMVVNYTEVKPNDNYLTFFAQTLIPDATYPLQILGVQFSSTNGITYNMSRGVRAYYKTTSDWGGNDTTDMTSNIKDAGYITKIVGINRIGG